MCFAVTCDDDTVFILYVCLHVPRTNILLRVTTLKIVAMHACGGAIFFFCAALLILILATRTMVVLVIVLALINSETTKHVVAHCHFFCTYLVRDTTLLWRLNDPASVYIRSVLPLLLIVHTTAVR